MTNKNFSIIEGKKHKINFNLSNVENPNEFQVFGFFKKIGCCNSVFELEKINNEFYIPELENGIYNYQIFIKQLSTNKDFLTLEGKLEVKNSLMAENNSSLGEIELQIAFDANTTEIHCEITKGLKGDSGLSTYEIAKAHGFVGTEKEWLNSLKQDAASIAIDEVQPMVEYVSNAVEEIEAKKEVILTAQNEIEQNKNIVLENSYNAENSATNAKVSEENAKASKEKVEEFYSEIQELNSETKINAQNAANSEQLSIAKANAASVSETNAAQSATAAANSASNAETSANSAAQSASEAAQSATLVEESVMTLPADYLRFSHVKSFDELAAQATDLLDTEVWRYPLNSLGNAIGDYFDKYFPNLKRVLIWTDQTGIVWATAADGASRYFTPRKKFEELRFVYPNATRLEKASDWGYNATDRLYIYAPKATWLSGYFSNHFNTKYLWCFSNYEGNYNWTWGSNVETIGYIGPVVKKLSNAELGKLKSVLCTFPLATLINFQKAKLDKESVLRILGGLLNYDANTMESVPELTLGIDPTLDGDAEINEALLLAQTAVEDGGKGWNVAVNGFTITAGGGVTMALRKPIYAQHWKDADGGYIDAGGVRFSIRYGNTILENWVANEQLGYEEFASIEDALTEWGLTEYQPETTEEQ